MPAAAEAVSFDPPHCPLLSHFIWQTVLSLQVAIKVLREHWLGSGHFVRGKRTVCFAAVSLPKANDQSLSLECLEVVGKGELYGKQPDPFFQSKHSKAAPAHDSDSSNCFILVLPLLFSRTSSCISQQLSSYPHLLLFTSGVWKVSDGAA